MNIKAILEFFIKTEVGLSLMHFILKKIILILFIERNNSNLFKIFQMSKVKSKVKRNDHKFLFCNIFRYTNIALTL